MPTPQKLNLLQTGLLQFLFSGSIFFLCLVLIVFGVDHILHFHCNNVLNILASRLSLSEDNLLLLKNCTDWGTLATASGIVLFVAGTAIIGFTMVKLSTRYNLVCSVTLPNAVECASALRKLGILESQEQMAFIRRYKIPLYISATPFLNEEQENSKAKRFCLTTTCFISKGLFMRSMGQRTLCIDAEDYAALMQENTRRASLETSAAVAEKNKEIQSLRTALSALTREHDALIEERNMLRNKVRIQPAQQDTRVERLRIERLLWSAYIPVIEDLLHRASSGTYYTTTELTAAFAAEWDRRADLRAQMQRLTGSDKAHPSENFIKAVKAEFKDAGKLSPGGRPRKNP